MAYLSRFVVSCASDLVGSQDLKVYHLVTNRVPRVVGTTGVLLRVFADSVIPIQCSCDV